MEPWAGEGWSSSSCVPWPILPRRGDLLPAQAPLAEGSTAKLAPSSDHSRAQALVAPLWPTPV